MSGKSLLPLVSSQVKGLKMSGRNQFRREYFGLSLMSVIPLILENERLTVI